MKNIQNELQNLAILYKITTSIFSIKDVDSLFVFSLEEAIQLSSSEIVALWFYDNESESLIIKKQIGIKEDTVSEYKIKDQTSLLWKSYLENKLKNTSVNSESDKFSIPFSKDYDINSCLVIPFRVENKNIGVFFFAKSDKTPYNTDDERMLTILASNCSVCYENLLMQENLIFFKTIFMSSRDAIRTLNPPSWKYTSGNNAAIEMFKAKDEADLLLYTSWMLSPETQPDGKNSKEKAKEIIEKAMKDGAALFEWVFRRLNNEEFYAEVLLSKVGLGEDSYLISSVRDISKQKKIEEEMKEHNKEIEKMNQLMIGRELKMIELKKEIKRLTSQINA